MTDSDVPWDDDSWNVGDGPGYIIVTDEDGNVVERIPVERGQDAVIVDPSDERASDNGTSTDG